MDRVNRRKVLSMTGVSLATGLAGCSSGGGGDGKSGGDSKSPTAGSNGGGGNADLDGTASSSVDGLKVTDHRQLSASPEFRVELTIENVGNSTTSLNRYRYDMLVTPESAGLTATNVQFPNDTDPDGPGDDEEDPPGDTGRAEVYRTIDMDAAESYEVTISCDYGTPTPIKRGTYCQ